MRHPSPMTEVPTPRENDLRKLLDAFLERKKGNSGGEGIEDYMQFSQSPKAETALRGLETLIFGCLTNSDLSGEEQKKVMAELEADLAMAKELDLFFAASFARSETREIELRIIKGLAEIAERFLDSGELSELRDPVNERLLAVCGNQVSQTRVVPERKPSQNWVEESLLAVCGVETPKNAPASIERKGIIQNIRSIVRKGIQSIRARFG